MLPNMTDSNFTVSQSKVISGTLLETAHGKIKAYAIHK